MGVHVDEAGAEDKPLGGDDPFGISEVLSNSGDLTVLDAQILPPGFRPRSVDDQGTLYHKI
ncbi:hypothetical protein MASR2M79_21730 [Aminivibrio sp.]